MVQSTIEHKSFHASKFAIERKRVLNADSIDPTSCWEDAKHKFSHDYIFGGIVCPIAGDPLDPLQRSIIVLSTVLVTMCVNLLLLPPSVTQDPSCNETYTGTIDCDGEPVEPGVWNMIITAGITTPLVTILVGFFKHLRKPLMQSVEPKLSIVALGLPAVVIILATELCCKCGLCRSRRSTVKLDRVKSIGAIVDVKTSAAGAARSARRRSVTAFDAMNQKLKKHGNAKVQRAAAAADGTATKQAPILRCGLQVTALAGRNLRHIHRESPFQPYLRISVITSHEIVTHVSAKAEVIHKPCDGQMGSFATSFGQSTPSLRKPQLAPLPGMLPAPVSIPAGATRSTVYAVRSANVPSSTGGEDSRARSSTLDAMPQADTLAVRWKPKSDPSVLERVISSSLVAGEGSFRPRMSYTAQKPSGAFVLFDFLVSENLPMVHIECLDAGIPIGDCVVDLSMCARGLDLGRTESDVEGDVSHPWLATDWSWPAAAHSELSDLSGQDWFTLKPTAHRMSSTEGQDALIDGSSAQVRLHFDWVSEQTITNPDQHDQWRDASRTASARHWRDATFFRAYLYAVVVASTALYFVASFVSNMSTQDTKAWAISVIGATVTKLFVMDPAKLFVMTGLLQCVESCPGAALIVEQKMTAMQTRE